MSFWEELRMQIVDFSVLLCIKDPSPPATPTPSLSSLIHYAYLLVLFWKVGKILLPPVLSLRRYYPGFHWLPFLGLQFIRSLTQMHAWLSAETEREITIRTFTPAAKIQLHFLTKVILTGIHALLIIKICRSDVPWQTPYNSSLCVHLR
jgi:hypothetical protein